MLIPDEEKQSNTERNLLAAIIDSSDDIIVSKTLDGIITSWNRGAQRILGYSADEVIGQHVSMLMPPDALEDTKKILDAIRQGQKVDHYETRRRRKDGTVIDVSLTVSPIRNGEGTIVGASKVGRDITQQRRLTEAVREANRRKDEFLALLAHEMRNPLSAISNAIFLAQKCELDDTLRWSTEVIERQAKHLTRLIEDLLDVSRINLGKLQLQLEVVDLGPVLNAAVEAVRPLIEERKHTLTVALGAGILRVNADPVRIGQIVVNLLTNAAKYTDRGGHIWLTADPIDSEIVIKVRDTGLGIPPDKLPQMFELFVQGDRSVTRSESGLGIGLNLVKNIVEAHDGSISAWSEGPGKGSEFTVRLPAWLTPQKYMATTTMLADSGSRRYRVLVVDDNADAASSLTRMLLLMGHDVQTADNGAKAVPLAVEFAPDVVFLDIGLPGMDGYEVARRLRQLEACQHSIIAALSGYGQEDDRRRSREAGCNHHFLKPIDIADLLKLLP